MFDKQLLVHLPLSILEPIELDDTQDSTSDPDSNHTDHGGTSSPYTTHDRRNSDETETKQTGIY